MASTRDKARETACDALVGQGGTVHDLLRAAWEAGRRYEVERLDKIARHRMTLTSREDDRGEGAM